MESECNKEHYLEPPTNFNFPYTPYEIQYEFMKNMYSVLENRKLGIFESPTGTGKSLSLICGAVTWLKDHNNFIKNQLLNKISSLESQKKQLQSSDDWLSAQSKEIEITQILNSLKITQNKILEYDTQINNLRNNREQLKLRKKKCVTKKKEENDLVNTEDNILEIEDDVLLEEPDNINEENFENEELEDKKYHPTKIYIASRTHAQLSQLVGEIKKCSFGKDLRVSSLASRQNYCINANVLSLKNMSLINERCLNMQKKASKVAKLEVDGKVTKKKKNSTCNCEYLKQEPINDLRDWALIEVQDIEDLVQSGREIAACPYYASRKAAEDAEVVLIPYNTLLHKATREANGVYLKDNIVIIDEAHNLLEALAQMYSSEISYSQVYYSLEQLKCYKKRYNSLFSAANLLCINQLIFVSTKLLQVLDRKFKEDSTEIFTLANFVLSAEIDNFNMFKLIQFCKTSKIAQKISTYSAKYPIQEEMTKKPPKKGVKDFLASIASKKDNSAVLDQKPNENPEQIPVPSNPLLAIISFLESLTYSFEDGRILLTKNINKIYCKLQFLLLNPSSNFNDIVRDARSVIVAGGTMKPMAEFRERLFINAGASKEKIVEFSCDHIIPPENILPIVVTHGPKNENLLFNFANRMSMGNSIKEIMQQVCNIVKGGVVVFFPSYKYEEWVWQQVKNINFNRPVFREPQTSGSVDAVLDKYADAIKKGASQSALLLSVVGGKLSEGLNFSDDLGRCVMVVGLPYANATSADLKEKMNYLDKKEGYGSGHKFYENLCMKAVNQCIGRAVRHKDDYATVLLLDERFNRTSTKSALPNWIKRSIKVGSFEKSTEFITQFFENRKVKNNSISH